MPMTPLIENVEDIYPIKLDLVRSYTERGQRIAYNHYELCFDAVY